MQKGKENLERAKPKRNKFKSLQAVGKKEKNGVHDLKEGGTNLPGEK